MSVHYWEPDTIGLVVQNTIVTSTTNTADAVPTSIAISYTIELSVPISINVDIKGWVSRDDGITWTQILLVDSGTDDDGYQMYSGAADVSDQPSSNLVRWKLTSHNNKYFKLRGWGGVWY
jgi:hypothetical protein